MVASPRPTAAEDLYSIPSVDLTGFHTSTCRQVWSRHTTVAELPTPFRLSGPSLQETREFAAEVPGQCGESLAMCRRQVLREQEIALFRFKPMRAAAAGAGESVFPAATSERTQETQCVRVALVRATAVVLPIAPAVESLELPNQAELPWLPSR